MTDPSPTAGDPAASARGRSRLVLVACVLLLAGAGVVARRTLSKRPAGPEQAQRKLRGEQAVIDLEPFVLNLPDAAGDRYFRLDLALVVDDAALAARAQDGLHAAKLRDRMLAVLARVRPATLTVPGAKEELRAELRAAAEALMAEPPFATTANTAPARVLDVYFTEFLLQ